MPCLLSSQQQAVDSPGNKGNTGGDVCLEEMERVTSLAYIYPRTVTREHTVRGEAKLATEFKLPLSYFSL